MKVLYVGTWVCEKNPGVQSWHDSYKPLNAPIKDAKDSIMERKVMDDHDAYGVIRFHCGVQMIEVIDELTDDIWVKCSVCGCEFASDDYENATTGRIGTRYNKDLLMEASYLLYLKYRQDMVWDKQKKSGMNPVGFNEGFESFLNGKSVVRLEATGYLNKKVAELDPVIKDWVKKHRKEVSNIYFSEKATEEIYCENNDPVYNLEYIGGHEGNVDSHCTDYHNRSKSGKEVGVNGWKRKDVFKVISRCIKAHMGLIATKLFKDHKWDANDGKRLEILWKTNKYSQWLSAGDKEYLKGWLDEIQPPKVANNSLASILS